MPNSIPDDFGPVPKAGQQVQPTPDFRAIPAQVGGGILDAMGITPAIRALRGEMTPEEAQMFALGALPMALPIAGEAKAAESIVGEALPKAITAFHGSPYDFQAFDISKIGTGEGAQAYGHGLYFAENPETAQSYKEAAAFPKPDPKAAPGTNGAQWLLYKSGGDINKAISEASKMLDRGRETDPLYGESLPAALERLKSGDVKHAIGKMYEVNIKADPEHFLDWDKPLSKAHEQKILPLLSKEEQRRLVVGKEFDPDNPHQGGHLWEALVRTHGDEAAASAKLREAGIPGIRYLDQGSRAAVDNTAAQQIAQLRQERNIYSKPGYANTPKMQKMADENIKAIDEELSTLEAGMKKQTSNYVVFDDKLIDIVKKYGLAGLIAGGASNWTPKGK